MSGSSTELFVSRLLGVYPLAHWVTRYLRTISTTSGPKFFMARDSEVDEALLAGDRGEEGGLAEVRRTMARLLARRDHRAHERDPWSDKAAVSLHALTRTDQKLQCYLALLQAEELTPSFDEDAPLTRPDTGSFAMLADCAELERRLQQELARARRRNGGAVSVVAIEVATDTLKADAGAIEASFRDAEAYVARNLRNYDLCCSLGVGRLLALLPDATAQDALRVVARMQRGTKHESRALALRFASASWPDDGPVGEDLSTVACARLDGGARPATTAELDLAAVEAETSVQVRFAGLPSPIRARAVQTKAGLRLRAALSFLRLDSPVQLSMGGGTSPSDSQLLGKLRSVVLAASRHHPIPWLQIDVDC